MESSNHVFTKKLEKKKNQLNKAVKEYGLNSENTLKISREVDNLIIQYYTC